MTNILLVEDTQDLARIIQNELQGAGYQVVHVSDGESALISFQQEKPDLVILDWMLPGMDGLEVLKHMRQEGLTPILMLTARDSEIDRVLGLEMGADDYLTKPFSMPELIARVRSQIRRQQQIAALIQADRSTTQTLIQIGPLVIDASAHTAHLGDNELDLSPTEFDLLHLMVRNPGRAFSRSYLLDTVWDSGYISGDRSVDNSILRLRRKLGSAGEAIETVWGIGYRWNEERCRNCV